MTKGMRLSPKHDEKTRAKIQTSQIINQLQKHVKGEVGMTSSQIRAADILLRKALPDLKMIEAIASAEEKKCAEVVIYIPDNGRNDPAHSKDWGRSDADKSIKINKPLE